jgi:hypothetical protein
MKDQIQLIVDGIQLLYNIWAQNSSVTLRNNILEIQDGCGKILLVIQSEIFYRFTGYLKLKIHTIL